MGNVGLADVTSWPLLRSQEAGHGHIAPVQVLGQEYIVWRDADGRVNVWEDRCPHRGVRLGIGTVAGDELKCRYHGWRYATGSGACTFVPAQPDRTPPKAARTRLYRCVERYGFVWLLSTAAADVPHMPEFENGPLTSVRSVTIRAALVEVAGNLGTNAHGAPHDRPQVVIRMPSGSSDSATMYLLLPEEHARTTVHGIVSGLHEGAARHRLLREHNDRLKALRSTLEARRRNSVAGQTLPASESAPH